MFDFKNVYDEIEVLFNQDGRTIAMAGETENVWIFRGTFVDGDDINLPIIVEKSSGEKRNAHPMYDKDILLTAKILIDNRK